MNVSDVFKEVFPKSFNENTKKRLKFSTSTLPFEFATAIGESTEVCGETRTCCPKPGPNYFCFWKLETISFKKRFFRFALSVFSEFQSLSGQVVPPFSVQNGPFLKVPQQRTTRWLTGVCPCEAESQRDSTSDFKTERLGENANQMAPMRPVLLPIELCQLCQYPTHLQLRV